MLTPMLAMTANVFSEDRQHSLDAAMDDHLGKPLPPAELYEAFVAWLERGRAGRVQPVGDDPVGGTEKEVETP